MHIVIGSCPVVIGSRQMASNTIDITGTLRVRSGDDFLYLEWHPNAELQSFSCREFDALQPGMNAAAVADELRWLQMSFDGCR